MSKFIIHVISDTHGSHRALKMPGGDAVIHCGDFCPKGSEKDVREFMLWFSELPYKHKICVPGNHDVNVEGRESYWQDEFRAYGIYLLIDSGVEIEGIKIYGSPVTPRFRNWAYNKDRGEDINKHWSIIPDDTEILITHGPPLNILDRVLNDKKQQENVGDLGLREKVFSIDSIKLHLFGHIHLNGKEYEFEGDKLFVNAAMLNESYSLWNAQPIEIIREILQDGSVLYTPKQSLK